MEIELKYTIDDPAKVDQIFADEEILLMRDAKKETQTPMHAVYYDTAEGDLRKERIAFRIRREGETCICTVKWGGSSEQGLHRRGEINVPVTDPAFLENPTLEVFQQSEIWDRLVKYVGKKLVPLLDMYFVRREIRLDNGKSISVFSIDQGEIQGNGKKLPILELEIELFSGEESEILRIGEYVSRKYGLVPEDRSKFSRGWSLVQGEIRG